MQVYHLPYIISKMNAKSNFFYYYFILLLLKSAAKLSIMFHSEQFLINQKLKKCVKCIVNTNKWRISRETSHLFT